MCIYFYINLLSTLFLNRIYQFARLNYTRKATSNKPETAQFYDIEGGNSNTLLNLDPENVVFYVGGYPPDFTVSPGATSLRGAWALLSGVSTYQLYGDGLNFVLGAHPGVIASTGVLPCTVIYAKYIHLKSIVIIPTS